MLRTYSQMHVWLANGRYLVGAERFSPLRPPQLRCGRPFPLVHFVGVLAIWHFIGISVFMMADFMIMHLIVRRAKRYNVQLNGSDIQGELEEKEMLITTETETTKKRRNDGPSLS